MGSRALWVAGVAGALLLVVLTVDATMNRTYTIDVHDGTGWRTVGTDDHQSETRAAKPVAYFGPVNASANDTLRMRLTLDNGYPWSASETFTVTYNDREFARGTVEAAGRSLGEAEFSIPAAPFYASMGASPTKEPATVSAFVNVEVDGRYVYASFELKET